MGAPKTQLSPRLVIFDLDDCLFDHAPDFVDHFERVIEVIIKEKCPGVDREDIIRAHKDGYEKEGLSFIPFSKAPFNLSLTQIFNETHDRLQTDYVLPLAEEFRRSHDHLADLRNKDTKVAILTHGSERWAKYLVEIMQLDDIFTDENIFSIEEFDFNLKNKNRKAFSSVLHRMGFDEHGDLSDIVMIDDSPKNLYHPKEMGMTTAHIALNGKIDADYIDYSVSHIRDFVKMLANKPAPQEPAANKAPTHG